MFIFGAAWLSLWTFVVIGSSVMFFYHVMYPMKKNIYSRIVVGTQIFWFGCLVFFNSYILWIIFISDGLFLRAKYSPVTVRTCNTKVVW